MAKMTILFLLVFFGWLAMAIVHPIYPLLAYLFEYYLPPYLNWWGSGLPDLRWSLLASVVLAISVAVHYSGLEPLTRVKNIALPWLTLFGANSVLVTFTWAFDRARSWVWSLAAVKLIVLYTLIPIAVRTPAHFDMVAAVHIGGAAYWGYKAWDNPKRSAGRLEQVGGPDSQNDNQAAGHLLTVLPFVAVYLIRARRRTVQALVAVCGAFILNVFILCNSRGATLGLLSTLVAAFFLAGRGRRVKMVQAGAIGLAALLFLADPEFIARQQTTANPQDNSAQSRLVFWQAGFEMVRDHPLGGGGRGFHVLSPRYIADYLFEENAEERSPHNTAIQLATDWGVQGTMLWLAFMLQTFRMLHWIRRAQRDNADSWYFDRSLAIELGLVGTLVASLFSSRLYGESIYWLAALAFALYRMERTAADTSGQTEPALAATGVVHQDSPAARLDTVAARGASRHHA